MEEKFEGKTLEKNKEMGWGLNGLGLSSVVLQCNENTIYELQSCCQYWLCSRLKTHLRISRHSKILTNCFCSFSVQILDAGGKTRYEY